MGKSLAKPNQTIVSLRLRLNLEMPLDLDLGKPTCILLLNLVTESQERIFEDGGRLVHVFVKRGVDCLRNVSLGAIIAAFVWEVWESVLGLLNSLS
jgi:hypothetical protein